MGLIHLSRNLLSCCRGNSCYKKDSCDSRTGQLGRLAAGLAVSAITLCPAGDAKAVFQTFFGEDINPAASAGPNAPNNQVPRLASFPNAAAARGNFSNALLVVENENFSSFSTGAPPQGGLVLTYTQVQATLSGGNGQIRDVPLSANGGQGTTNGQFGTSPTRFWGARAGGDSNFVVNFSTPIAAFGFYASDFGDFGAILSLVLTRSDSTTTTLLPPVTPGSGGSTSGSVFFFGAIEFDPTKQISSVSFQTTAATDDLAFDDFIVGTLAQVDPAAVPAPLPALGAAVAFGWSRRLRRRISASSAKGRTSG
ncbi:hypothetical protein [Synechococcus sp. CS-1324]|uniref:hypothetical protein n=1 Tax=Synechococcus sp. CS-1324 TaxID=2847980 RepID=UPI00223B1C26|nr:hypothetical protein [Synechococcus sp. CS-1324]